MKKKCIYTDISFEKKWMLLSIEFCIIVVKKTSNRIYFTNKHVYLKYIPYYGNLCF